ncbi:hypothetical protein PanWU01x14_198750 [Parasponia andersonii]|uniref:Uncharacterized protein n=1 Tax=Parasponia andersonii TaxID=3476 RepID=A0A2P5BYX9_PARAD|nr:hypothetical protein PanWU01x14_198750 [Parasponia andersonii]
MVAQATVIERLPDQEEFSNLMRQVPLITLNIHGDGEPQEAGTLDHHLPNQIRLFSLQSLLYHDMASVDPILHALLAKNRDREGKGRNSLCGNLWPTYPGGTPPLRISKLTLATTIKIPPSSGRPDKRPIDIPHLDEPPAQ